jgi:hypothetical protein
MKVGIRVFDSCNAEKDRDANGNHAVTMSLRTMARMWTIRVTHKVDDRTFQNVRKLTALSDHLVEIPTTINRGYKQALNNLLAKGLPATATVQTPTAVIV